MAKWRGVWEERRWAKCWGELLGLDERVGIRRRISTQRASTPRAFLPVCRSALGTFCSVLHSGACRLPHDVRFLGANHEITRHSRLSHPKRFSASYLSHHQHRLLNNPNSNSISLAYFEHREPQVAIALILTNVKPRKRIPATFPASRIRRVRLSR